MTRDPVSGPLSRDRLKELSEAPHGEALSVIREYDPMFGRPPGEKVKWRVAFTRAVIEEGYAVVEAESEKQALELAARLEDDDIMGGGYGVPDDWDVDSVAIALPGARVSGKK